MKKEKQKEFLIVNSYLIGDILLVNSLIQNIKKIYKNSKIIMLTSPNLYEVAKYQEGVDEAIVWDRHGIHKGFLNMLKFVWNFPYKNIYAAFPIYGMDRPIMLSKLLGAKYILFHTNAKNIIKKLFKSKYKINFDGYFEKSIQSAHLHLLSGITKEEIKDCAIKYNIDKNTKIILNENIKNYTVICPITTKITKDIPLDIVIDIINSSERNFILLGAGKKAQELSDNLKNKNLRNLIDLTNKTTIQEAALIIKNAQGTISADTGLLHLSCAVNTPTLGIFYTTNTKPFMPNEKLYNAKILFENQTAENIMKNYKELIERN